MTQPASNRSGYLRWTARGLCVALVAVACSPARADTQAIDASGTANGPEGLALVQALEAQAEFHLAWERFGPLFEHELEGSPCDAAGPAPVSACRRADHLALVQLALRLRQRLGGEPSAAAILARYGAHLPFPDRDLLAARLSLEAGAAESTLAILRRVKWPPALGAYANYLDAQASALAGDWDQVAATALAALRGELPIEMRRHLRVLDARAALGRHDLPRLATLADQLGVDARYDDRNGAIVVDLARAALAAGHVEQATTWLLDLLAARPAAAESAYAVLYPRTLRAWVPSPAAALRLARFESRGRVARARTRLTALVTRTNLSRDERADVVVELARLEQATGQHRRCLQTLKTHATALTGTSAEPERLRLAARSLRLVGDEAGAIAVYQDLARRFPSHPRADDALYEVAWRHEIRGEMRAAETAFARVAELFPSSALCDDVILRQGLCALRDARYEDALTHFAALPERYPDSPLVARALYWRMWIYESRGDTTKAKAMQRQLVTAHPYSWFAVLAGGGTLGAPSDTVSTRRTPTAVAVHNHECYQQALARLRQAPGTTPPQRFREQSRLWRFLLDYGFDVESSWVSRRLENTYARTPGALLAILAANYGHGVHASVIRTSFQLGLLLADPTEVGDIEVIRYPAPYSVSLAQAAARTGISHATLLAVMRQESAFDARVDSRAGARGLLQLMPSTGTTLARRLGRHGFHADELYDPDTNIALGSYLLARELEQARAGMPQALAAYNAGREVAARWAKRLQPNEPPELYADVAEYYETRDYIERVLGGAAVYRRLYGLE